MNCIVCGNPLPYDRVVFHCSCGVFVHAYCWDAHVLQAHQPSYEIGTVNLDGEFTARESKVEEQASGAQASEEPGPEEPNSEEQNSEEQNSKEETTPLLE